MFEIRRALENDFPDIKQLVKLAFYRDGRDEVFNEWEFVTRIKEDKAYINELCLIATFEEKVVGYILLTKATIDKKPGLSLGPLAVIPSLKNLGIGKQLVEYGIEQAKILGYEWIALTGGNYYTRFGFEPASSYNIILSENNPENEYLKILFLNRDIASSIQGTMRFADSFYNEKGELL